MLCGIIIFHKNIFEIYNPIWINKCLDSIFSQTFQNFSILELNYGSDDTSIILNNHNKPYHYWNIPMKNHVYAMNFLLDKAFNELNYDIIFNINLDDYYDPTRFEKQIPYIVDKNYDIVSSDFKLIEEGNDIVQQLQVGKKYYNNDLIKMMLLRKQNIIAHPCVAYSKNFWLKMKQYSVNDIPVEDMKLWQSALKQGLQFKIIPEFLLYHRLHGSQITAGKRTPKKILRKGIIVV